MRGGLQILKQKIAKANFCSIRKSETGERLKIFVESDERCKRKKTQEHKSEIPIQPATAAKLFLTMLRCIPQHNQRKCLCCSRSTAISMLKLRSTKLACIELVPLTDRVTMVKSN